MSLKSIQTPLTARDLDSVRISPGNGVGFTFSDPGTYVVSGPLPWYYSDTDNLAPADMTAVDAGTEVTFTVGSTPVSKYCKLAANQVGQTINLKINFDQPSGVEAVVSAFGLTLIDDSSASAARTTLGLGTMSTQAASAVAITGGTANSLIIGGSTPAAGSFTTIGATGQITSTLADGTAPLVVTSTTVVDNLNVSKLNGTTASGGGAFVMGGFTLTVPATGTAALLGSTNAFTGNNTSSGTLTISNSTAASANATGALIVTGGVSASAVSFFNSGVLFGNFAAAYDTTRTNATIYGTTTSGGSYPFLESGNLIISPRISGASRDVIITTNGTAPGLTVARTNNVVVGSAALATNATDGFIYMPTCAGTPTGVPTAFTGRIAWCYDSTNNIIYLYNGAWKKTAALT
jgi:hypothetical protein